MNLTMTPAAEKFIRRLLRFDGGPGSGLSMSVSPGGCSGLSAEFSVANAPAAGEQVFELNGVKLFLPAESRLLLDGVTIDFMDTATKSAFVFHDPKYVGSCSTASSMVSGVVSLSSLPAAE